MNDVRCDVDLGIFIPGECVTESDGSPNSNDIRVVTTCFVNGDISVSPGELSGVLVSLDYDYVGDNGNTYLADKDEMGSIWAVAYNQREDNVYAAAMLKRHTGMGPEGPGAIYQHNLSNSNNSLFVDLESLGINVGSEPQLRDLREPGQPSYDIEAFGLVGKMSLGDMDIDEANQILYVMNLFDKRVYGIDINTQQIVSTHDTPDPGCNAGEWRPWAIKHYQGRLYIGGVCDGSDGGMVDDLIGYIYKLNEGSFTEVLSIPLNYRKGRAVAGADIETWSVWVNEFSEFMPNERGTIIHHQPILALSLIHI